MKLLLTSAGFTNKTIENALVNLAGKPCNELDLAFIPTAANVEEGDKGWLIDDLNVCKNLFKSVDIVDFSAVPLDVWKKRFESVDVLLFGGGNTFHLMYWMEQVQMKQYLDELLKTKIYVGISAGSMVAANNLAMSQSARLYSEEMGKLEKDQGLGYVNFHIRPHFHSPHFPKITEEYLQEAVKELSEPIYALDDLSAIQVVDQDIKVISEGEWKLFNA
jgi:dipeptidase E